MQSATSINMYHRCPRKYYLRYILRTKQKSSIYLIRGTAVHEAIAGFHNLKMPGSLYPDRKKAALHHLFNDAWLRHGNELQQLGLGDRTIKQYYQESWEMLKGWLKRYERQGRRHSGKTSAEVKLFSKTYYVMGIIDAIENHNGIAMITDYKTSKKDDITPDIKIQMAIYALLYREKFGAPPDIVAIDFLKTNRERRFRVTRRFIEYALELVTDIHKKTVSKDEKDYPCTCGGWCQKDFILKNGGR
jgi:CRISPR/Cas system-associated exonuclease Cas4 (RecB family)